MATTVVLKCFCFFFFSSRRRHTRLQGDWSSDVCSSDLGDVGAGQADHIEGIELGCIDGSRREIATQANFTKIAHQADRRATLEEFRSEERRVGKECRSRWSPYH